MLNKAQKCAAIKHVYFVLLFDNDKTSANQCAMYAFIYCSLFMTSKLVIESLFVANL